MNQLAFWDTSAIVPLCCSQAFSVQAWKTRRGYGRPVIWWGTPVEVHSAFQRLLRQGHLTENSIKAALHLWQRFQTSARMVNPVNQVVDLAQIYPTRYELPALDSFQLAAAVVWTQENPRKRPFVTADQQLAQAAAALGFSVVSAL